MLLLVPKYSTYITNHGHYNLRYCAGAMSFEIEAPRRVVICKEEILSRSEEHTASQ